MLLRKRLPITQRHSLKRSADTFDRDDRCLTLAEFNKIVALLGRNFDIDACANDNGDNALVPNFCSPSSSFLLHNCACQHVWCNPPFAQAEAFLQN